MKMVVVDIYEIDFEPTRDDEEEEAENLVDLREDTYFWGRYIFKGTAPHVTSVFRHLDGERRK